MHWIQFFGGMFIGALIGFLTCALFVAGSREVTISEETRRRILADIDDAFYEADRRERDDDTKAYPASDVPGVEP